MFTFKKILLPALFFLLLLTPVQANGKKPSNFAHHAKKSEIVGFWKLVNLPKSVQKINKINPWPMPYQWFGIYENGQMNTMMGSKDATQTSEKLDQTFQTLPSSLNYKFHKGLLIVTNPEIKKYGELWLVEYIEKDAIVANALSLKKGDLLMSLRNPKTKAALYYRHLRKID